MFLLIPLVALANFALGYWVAVYMGWASWPAFALKPREIASKAP